ncbi:Beta-glucosidase 46 [Acorus calamus]|uniref:Beta-glucosidase 46 n=1 Tax=Acorus calamus TaxID=4465 RepID=A0AAV9FTV8_ACOCL|nr:Beta-glucosidase 46 [Acorus calamus]
MLEPRASRVTVYICKIAYKKLCNLSVNTNPVIQAIHSPMESSVDLRMFVFLILISPIWATKEEHHSFPNNFLFGTASAAYQFEGAYLSDGKGLNNWDVYTNTPGGIHGGVNLPGINFYNNLIDSFLEKGIKPFVTLSHYDLPQELEDRYGSWLHKDIQEDFAYYADVCFGAFGDRVQYWATFNEPNIIAMQGYRTGLYPPSRCSKPFGNCTHGDSDKEPFIVAHNIILSHMKAVKIYRTKYQKRQGGSIGFIVNAIWFEPISNSIADRLAAKRALSFLVSGSHHFREVSSRNARNPGIHFAYIFKKHQMDLQNGLDFIGINHYTTLYVKDCMFSACGNGMGCSRTEGFACQTGQKNEVPIREPTVMEWYYVTPQGMEDMVMYLKERYNNKPIFVTENGYPDENWVNATIKDFLYDINRVNYMRSYLDSLATAISKGEDVRGYFAWALLDNFEWISGYTKRFGLHHVDFKTMKRTPKLSATWYKQYIDNHSTIIRTTHERNQEYLQSY